MVRIERLLACASLPFLLLTDISRGQCETGMLVAGDAATFDVLGWSGDLSGDLIALGAIGCDDLCGILPDCNAGAVYVFRERGGVWSEEAKLFSSDPGDSHQFGHDVAVSGDRILVGEHLNGPGAAYVFKFDGNAWIEEQQLTGSDSQTMFHFGHSVALQGDTAVVGVMRDNHAGNLSGAAFVFVRDGSTWSERPKLTAGDTGAGDLFGRTCDIDGDAVIVGAHRHNEVGVESGAAYIFERDDNGTAGDPLDDIWLEATKLVPGDAAPGDRFGRSVGVFGDTAIVGASLSQDSGVATGAAYIFERGVSGWVEVQKITASDGASDDRFGISVSIDGDHALVGAYQADAAGAGSGAAYLFERTPGGWVETARLVGSATAAGDQLGHETGVAVAGGRGLITSRFSATSSPADGAGYVFELTDCLGSSFCVTTLNSAGPGALISASGSTSISADDFNLECAGAVPAQFGVFFYSGSQTQIPFGDGFLCVGPPAVGVFRLHPVVQMNGAGTVTLQLDFDAHPAGTPGSSEITPGSTWNFQFWYRDPNGPGGSVSNLSDGLNCTFIP